MNEENQLSVMDYIIQKWFPIIGILFVVGGISYLFYDGIWQTLEKPGRLMLGIILGIGMIGGGYSFEKKLKNFADALIGGGILTLYISLIYGSKFNGELIDAVIPEVITLLIAGIFSVAVYYYSWQRKSINILLLGMLGGYLTPFFIGQTQGFDSFLEAGQYNYGVSLLSFLIYFLVINVSLLFVSQKLFLRGIGVLNSLGMFLGTFSLLFLMGEQFVNQIELVAGFSVIVVILHIMSMSVNAKNFQSEYDPFLTAGYLLPLVWFYLITNIILNGYFEAQIQGLLFLIITAVYFVAWNYLRQTTDSDKHFSLYIGGMMAGIFAFLELQTLFDEISGLVLSAFAIFFAILYYIKPLIQREISFIVFALFGFLFSLINISSLEIAELGPISGETIFLIFSLLPFLASFVLPKTKNEEILFNVRQVLAYLASVIIIGLLFNDLIDIKNIPGEFLLFTIPSALLALLAYTKKDIYMKTSFISASLLFGIIGFFPTFFEMLNRFYPAPENLTLFSTRESLIGVSSLIIFGFMQSHLKRNLNTENLKENSGLQFFLTFLFYLTLWVVVTHELLLAFNSFGFDFTNPAIIGIRAFTVTIWWVALGLFMVLRGTQKSHYLNEKNIGMCLLAVTVVKLIFYDLGNINTNLKVFLFILIGLAILGVSYMANKKSLEK